MICPAPSSYKVAEVAEEALKLVMRAGDAGALHPPDTLAVADMSVSTFSRAP